MGIAVAKPGFLRILIFRPGENRVSVTGYSPFLDEIRGSAPDTFEIPYAMTAQVTPRVVTCSCGASCGEGSQSDDGTEGFAPLCVRLDATQIYNPEGVAVSYAWDLGNGGSASDAVAQVTFEDPGTYTVRLSTHGENGLVMNTEVEVVVNSTMCNNGLDDDLDGSRRASRKRGRGGV